MPPESQYSLRESFSANPTNEILIIRGSGFRSDKKCDAFAAPAVPCGADCALGQDGALDGIALVHSKDSLDMGHNGYRKTRVLLNREGWTALSELPSPNSCGQVDIWISNAGSRNQQRVRCPFNNRIYCQAST